MKMKVMRVFGNVFAAMVLTAFFVIAMQTFVLKGEVCVKAVEEQAASVIVTDRDEFVAALEQKQTSIIVDGTISVSVGELGSGKMLPAIIPAGTVITATEGSSLDFRCPIQLGGDGVIFKDITIHFSSSDALGSVPHREIFLAGYSLTLDNVSTYLEGSSGSLGGLGGTEDELLPTVYGGAFETTNRDDMGDHASLTIRNSNSETMFKGIYMNHEEEYDSKMQYIGEVTVSLDSKVLVREGIHTELGATAHVTISDVTTSNSNLTCMTTAFYGNEGTTVSFGQINVSDAVIDGVGQIILDEGAWITLGADSPSLCNVTVLNGAKLDYSNTSEATIKGDFEGGEYDEVNDIDTTGTLILDDEAQLTIGGSVSGSTKFEVSGNMTAGTDYIVASKTADNDFIINDWEKDTFYMSHEEGKWYVYFVPFEIGSVVVQESPLIVDINTVTYTVTSDSPGLEVYWKDVEGNVYDADTVYYEYLYSDAYVIVIKSEYWESENYDTLTDWDNDVYLESTEDYPNKYFIYTYDGVKTGEYTLLFLSERCYDELTTVDDVKNLADKVKAEVKIVFYDSETEEIPHVHVYTNGKCICGAYEDDMSAVVGHSLTLDGNIGVNFFIETAENVSDDAYIKFTLPDGTTSNVNISDITPEVKNNITCYRVTCEVAAKEMTEAVTVQLIDGEKEGSVFSHSVKQYADIIINDDTDTYTNEKPLVLAMLNYGAYAQQYFQYNTSDMSADLDKADVSAVTKETLQSFVKNTYSNDSVSLKAANLTLESETTLTLGFLPGIGVSVDNLTFTIGEESVQPVSKGGYTCVVIEGIAANNLDKDYVVTVNDGTNTLTVIYNPMTYCYNVLKSDNSATVTDNLKNVVRALYLYNQAANTYLGN